MARTKITSSQFMAIPTPAKEEAQAFLDYNNKSPTPYHAVQNAKSMLLDNGFTELTIESDWNLSKKGGYFITKGDTTIIAFLVGGQTTNGSPVALVATHTDSPSLKVKPCSKRGFGKYSQVGVTLYGGGTWYTWFDRELKLAGKVWVKRPGGQVESQLINIEKPLMYIPNLAIHYIRSDTFTPDLEVNVLPIIALAESDSIKSTESTHNPFLLKVVSDATQTAPEDIVEMDLWVVDYNPARLVGVNEDFIVGMRFDNQISTFAALKALINAKSSSFLSESKAFHVVVCFNNEEIGNNTTEGSRSDFTPQVIQKMVGGKEYLDQSIDQSFAISADVVHAVHPNYSNYHEENHRPDLDLGPVIKYNASMKYTTTGFSAMIAREVGRMAGINLQSFIIRNDSLSGSTLGPDLAALLGIDSVDMGTSMLAMHSIREFAGSLSISQARDFFEAFFQYYEKVRDSLE